MQQNTLTGYPSIDKPWLKYYNLDSKDCTIPKCTVYANIYENNKDYLSDVAILYFGKKITYGKFFDEISKTEKALLQNGIKYGDNIAICMPAIPETYYLILALNKIGANANLLNPTFTEEQLTDRIAETSSSLLFVVNELYDKVQNITKKAGIKKVISCPAVNSLGFFVKKIKKAKKIAHTTDWNDFIKEGNYCTAQNNYIFEKDTPAITVYSSGTTGASKGIQHTNESVNGLILQYKIGQFQINRGNKFIAVIPIWFSTGIIVSMLMPLKHGVSVIPVPDYNFELFNKLITKYKPHYMIATGATIEYLTTHHPNNKAYKHFIYLAAGGDYVTPHTEVFINDCLAQNGCKTKLHKGYGMCECGGTVSSTDTACNKVCSAGIPLPLVTVSAFDVNTGEELPYGQRGEIRVITPSKMIGYYKNADATEKYFHTDEKGDVWACTGDMGCVDEDGVVYVSGRISESYYNSKNELVYLFDIERAVANNRHVKQCKAVAVQVDGVLTHIANAVLYDDGTDTDTAINEIYDECKKVLPENHLPKYFKLYETALPVAPSGKLDVHKMKNEATDLIKVEK